MKNTFGNHISVTLFGESHGSAIGAVLDGIAPGIDVNEAFIAEILSRRRPVGAISTARQEADNFSIVSGVFNGKTTGTPICILIPNTDTRSGDYSQMRYAARPSHADYTAQCKYHGFQDYRGGGHFSGRLTAALCAAGAICLSALQAKGIQIGTHIHQIGAVCDRTFEDFSADIAKLNRLDFAVLDDNKKEAMLAEITSAKAEGDSVGGILETAVTGLPAGLGEPWFDTVEGLLSHAMFSIPAIKGVEFGAGFGLGSMRGSQANDPFYAENGEIKTKTNHAGGINGGITNGMPVVFRCAVRPTPTLAREQETVNLQTGENTTLAAKGRHDPCIVHRARIVVDCMTAITLCDILAGRYGVDWL
ncbi:MAG: chorismate synthase [Oscillospiraceae bacterium]|nr:chorismate synthase [Oscillospiraceae bacterium]